MKKYIRNCFRYYSNCYILESNHATRLMLQKISFFYFSVLNDFVTSSFFRLEHSLFLSNLICSDFLNLKLVSLNEKIEFSLTKNL